MALSHDHDDNVVSDAINTLGIRHSRPRPAFSPITPGTADVVTVHIKRFEQNDHDPWAVYAIPSLESSRSIIEGAITKTSDHVDKTLFLNSDVMMPGRPVTVDQLVELVKDKSVLVGGELKDIEVIVKDSALPRPASPAPVGSSDTRRRSLPLDQVFEYHARPTSGASGVHDGLVGNEGSEEEHERKKCCILQ